MAKSMATVEPDGEMGDETASPVPEDIGMRGVTPSCRGDADWLLPAMDGRVDAGVVPPLSVLGVLTLPPLGTLSNLGRFCVTFD